MPFVDPEGFSGGLWPPWLQSGWSPISRKRSPLELGLRRNRPNPNGSGAGLGPSAPGPRARTPHEILLCNNGQEEIRTAEILTRVDFIWAPSRSILKESNGIVERAPED